MFLRPFFSYYGSKFLACKKRMYPSPQYDTVIENFAGAAGYATNNFQRKIILYDLDPKIYGIWHYLINAKSSEVRALPEFVDHIDEVKAPQEAKWLIGFWLARGGSTPRKSPSPWMKSRSIGANFYWGKYIRGMIASQLKHIRHWKIFNKSYALCPNRKATWFVDPPYQCPAGRHYKHNKVNFPHLAQWCRERQGQVIVCEGPNADWLPFRRLKEINSTVKKGGVSKKSKEFVWIKTDRFSGFLNLQDMSHVVHEAQRPYCPKITLVFNTEMRQVRFVQEV